MRHQNNNDNKYYGHMEETWSQILQVQHKGFEKKQGLHLQWYKFQLKLSALSFQQRGADQCLSVAICR